MLDHPRTTLVDALRAAASLWAQENGKTLGGLSSKVVNHGSFFDRFECSEAGANTGTLEKFAAFLGNSENWPDGAVPDLAAEFVRRVEGRPPEAAPQANAA